METSHLSEQPVPVSDKLQSNFFPYFPVNFTVFQSFHLTFDTLRKLLLCLLYCFPYTLRRSLLGLPLLPNLIIFRIPHVFPADSFQGIDMALFLYRGRSWHFFFVNFIKFLSAYFSSLLILMWTEACSTAICCTHHSSQICISSSYLMRLYLVSPSRSLTKTSNNTHSSIDPCLHHQQLNSIWSSFADHSPLKPVVQAHYKAASLSTYPVYSSSVWLWISYWDMLTKDLTKDKQHLLLFPHPPSQLFLVEDYWVGQKLFPLCKSMLIPLNQFLHVFRNVFSD